MKARVILLAYIILSILAVFVIISIWGQNSSLGIWTGAGALPLLLIFFTKKKFGEDKVYDRIYPFCLLLMLMIMGGVQFSFIEKLRFSPAFDLDAVYGGAIEWVERGTFPDYYDYFDWFPNNLGCLCFFFLIFKACSFFFSDYFLIAACVNEILILLTILFISLSAKKIWGSRAGLLALFITAGMIPFWFMADAFYTDSLSVLFPVLIFYISLYINESKNYNYLGYILLSAFVAVFGTFIKPTVMIMGAAVFLSFLLQGKWKKAGVYAMALCVVYLVSRFLFQFYMYHTHLDPALAEIKNTPLSHWIMMGLKGDGAYNPEDYEFTRSFTVPQERNIALAEEIKNRMSEKGISGMAALYAVKLFRCLGDGTLGLSDFLDDNPQKETLLHQYILYDGRYYEKYRNCCNVIFYTCLLLVTVCLIENIRRMAKKNNTCCINNELSLALAFGGIVIFLMHWETSPRYITNYVPVILLLAVGGVQRFYERDS